MCSHELFNQMVILLTYILSFTLDAHPGRDLHSQKTEALRPSLWKHATDLQSQNWTICLCRHEGTGMTFLAGLHHQQQIIEKNVVAKIITLSRICAAEGASN